MFAGDQKAAIVLEYFVLVSYVMLADAAPARARCKARFASCVGLGYARLFMVAVR